MKRLRGILFDYGHTLVWFSKYEEAHRNSARNVQQILRRFGVSIEPEEIRTIIESYAPRHDGTSPSAEDEARGLLISVGVENFQQTDLQRIIKAEWEPYVKNVRIRKGVKEVLEYSKTIGLKLGIVANIWSGGMNPVLAKLGIEKFFDTKVASMDFGFAKPDPRIFRQALNDLELTPEQAIMVGDNPKADIRGAHDIGMRTVRLLRGPNKSEPDCVEADFKIRNLSTLPSIIHGLGL